MLEHVLLVFVGGIGYSFLQMINCFLKICSEFSIFNVKCVPLKLGIFERVVT